MKLAILSDLHNELEQPSVPRKPTTAWSELRKIRRSIEGHPDEGPLLTPVRDARPDLVVMAGDIGLGRDGITYADRAALFIGRRVVYVMGNHEAYGHDLADLVPELRAAAEATCGRVVFLENGSATFDLPDGRLHVLGCTLWTDYTLHGSPDEAMAAAEAALNDHRRVRFRGGRLSPSDALRFHDESRKWLGTEVARLRAEEGDDARLLIVTHHAPVSEANPPQFQGGKLCPAFASDMRAEIVEWRPAAWIWGHTHRSMDTTFGSTRLLSAQRGYVCDEPGSDVFLPAIVEFP